ncbi:30S ribosomal protein S15 [Bacillus sp. SG-1]|nr:30S ribosomal protein S15 [Bacillus sp. SG-1]
MEKYWLANKSANFQKFESKQSKMKKQNAFCCFILDCLISSISLKVYALNLNKKREKIPLLSRLSA